MDFEAVSKLLFTQFKSQNIRFALIGGFALHLAGITRATKDMDFLVRKEDMPKVKELMLTHGYELIHESEDVSNFWSPVKPLGNVDFLHAHRRYAMAMIDRATESEILDGQFKIKVVLPEDIIGLKLQAMVNDPRRALQDMSDIRGIIEINRAKLNMNLVREYFELFGQEAELKKILESLHDPQ